MATKKAAKKQMPICTKCGLRPAVIAISGTTAMLCKPCFSKLKEFAEKKERHKHNGS